MNLVEELDSLSYRQFVILLSNLSGSSVYVNSIQSEKEKPQELTVGQSERVITTFFN